MPLLVFYKNDYNKICSDNLINDNLNKNAENEGAVIMDNYLENENNVEYDKQDYHEIAQFEDGINNNFFEIKKDNGEQKEFILTQRRLFEKYKVKNIDSIVDVMKKNAIIKASKNHSDNKNLIKDSNIVVFKEMKEVKVTPMYMYAQFIEKRKNANKTLNNNDNNNTSKPINLSKIYSENSLKPNPLLDLLFKKNYPNINLLYIEEQINLNEDKKNDNKNIQENAMEENYDMELDRNFRGNENPEPVYDLIINNESNKVEEQSQSVIIFDDIKEKAFVFFNCLINQSSFNLQQQLCTYTKNNYEENLTNQIKKEKFCNNFIYFLDFSASAGLNTLIKQKEIFGEVYVS